MAEGTHNNPPPQKIIIYRKKKSSYLGKVTHTPLNYNWSGLDELPTSVWDSGENEVNTHLDVVELLPAFL